MRTPVSWLLAALGMLGGVAAATGEGGEETFVLGHVRFHQKISQTEGGFGGIVAESGHFGAGAAPLGDLDGNGTPDVAVGQPTSSSGFGGAVWILFLEPDGTVLAHQRVSDDEGGFTGTLLPGDRFGSSVAPLGDLDGDGVVDLAVGAQSDSTGGPGRGAVWILFLHPNGTVKAHQKIAHGEGGFTGVLADFDEFGSLAGVGDLDRDGVADLVVGAYRHDGAGIDRGAVWVLFLNADGTVKAHQRITEGEGGFTGTLGDPDHFGFSVAPLGDLDRDGVVDIAVGAQGDADGGGIGTGAVWILLLNSDGTVAANQKISATEGGFTGFLEASDFFGWSVGPLGDLDCDGTLDVAVGATGDDDGGDHRGSAWALFLHPDGTVKMHTKISDTSGSFTGELDDSDTFGSALGALGDLDGDRNVDLVVGAALDDDGANNSGAVWTLFLDGGGCFNPPIFTDGFERGDLSAWSGFAS